MKAIVYSILLLSFFSCKMERRSDSEIADSTSKDTIIQKADLVLQRDDEVIQFVDQFYCWYLDSIYKKGIDDYYMPRFMQIDSNSYIYNIDSYLSKLKKNEFFSDDYIRNDSAKLEECNKEMLTIQWEYEPEPEFNLKSCNFLWYGDKIIGGNGFIDEIRVTRGLKINNYKFQVFTVMKYNSKVYFTGEIEVSKVANGDFKIDKIVID